MQAIMTTSDARADVLFVLQTSNNERGQVKLQENERVDQFGDGGIVMKSLQVQCGAMK